MICTVYSKENPATMSGKNIRKKQRTKLGKQSFAISADIKVCLKAL